MNRLNLFGHTVCRKSYILTIQPKSRLKIFLSYSVCRRMQIADRYCKGVVTASKLFPPISAACSSNSANERSLQQKSIFGTILPKFVCWIIWCYNPPFSWCKIETYWNQAKFSYTTLGRILICPDVCPYVGQSLKWSYFRAVSRLFLNVNVLYVLEVLTHFI